MTLPINTFQKTISEAVKKFYEETGITINSVAFDWINCRSTKDGLVTKNYSLSSVIINFDNKEL